MFSLEGRVALVTGAGQGVGAGIARSLAEQGAAVVVNDLHAGRAEAVAAALAGGGARTLAVAFDVTDPHAVHEGVAVATGVLGPVDVLVNNAGIPAAGFPLVQFRHMDPALWPRFVELNLYGSLHCIREVIDGMCERRWGRIIQISSEAGRVGARLGISLYGASKAGIEGFVRHLAAEVARDGVTANTVTLGMMEFAGEEAVAALARSVPVGRLGVAADAAAAVVYLASEEASWVTGQTLGVNGGVAS